MRSAGIATIRFHCYVLNFIVVGDVMTDAMREDLLSSLRSIREDVQRQVGGLDRYRALMAIDQTIADFPHLQDVTSALGAIRDQVQEQLDETRQFRALRAIDRLLPELSEALALVAEPSEGSGSSEAIRSENDVLRDKHSAVDGQQPAVIAQGQEDVIEIDEVVADVCDTAATNVAPRDSDNPVHADVEARATAMAAATEDERLPVRPDFTQPEARPVPSLADSVAQLMAQSVSPPSREPQGTSYGHATEDGGDRHASQAERAA